MVMKLRPRRAVIACSAFFSSARGDCARASKTTLPLPRTVTTFSNPAASNVARSSLIVALTGR